MPEALSSDRVLPHELSTDEAIQRLKSDAVRGLSAAEAAARLAACGPSSLPTAPEPPSWLRFLRHFRDTQFYLLLIAAGISFLVWVLEGRRGLPGTDCGRSSSRSRGTGYDFAARKSQVDQGQKRNNRTKARVRSKVEWHFRILKRIFAYMKVRYRGLKKDHE